MSYKSISEIIAEYERNTEKLRERVAELRVAESAASTKREYWQLRRRRRRLEDAIASSTAAICSMREYGK